MIAINLQIAKYCPRAAPNTHAGLSLLGQMITSYNAIKLDRVPSNHATFQPLKC